VTEWLRTDEKKEAFEAMKLARQLLDNVDANPYYWKWVIVAIHSAMQATMVLALTGSSQLRVLSEKSAKEVGERQDAVRRLADFMELYKRVKHQDTMNLFVHSKPLEASREMDSSVSYLHSNLRNKFEHFLPGGWSIEIDDLPYVVQRCVSAISFLALESGNIFWVDNPSREDLQGLLTDITKKLTAMHV
jgi:hypothetical protein